MSLPSLPWVLPAHQAADRPAAASESPVASALGRCRPLFRRSVLVVAPADGSGWEALRLARDQGACVTALCRADQATEAKAAGADVILDPERTDPTWYRGAWSVIVDPAGEIGYRRAARSLGPGGSYVTSSPRPSDRARAVLAGLSGGPRLLRLRD
jgi:NADPH:quinone reductase-like Zn-dependent oxidoreductase